MTKYSIARQRGFYPESEPTSHMSPTVPVQINLPKDLFNWLAHFVGKNSFTFNVEEAIITGLRCTAGKDYDHGMDLSQLVGVVCSERGVSAAEALFGPIYEGYEAECGKLLQAAEYVARFGQSPAWTVTHGPDADDRLIAAWRAVAPDRDIAGEHAEAVAEMRRVDEEGAACPVEHTEEDDGSPIPF